MNLPLWPRLSEFVKEITTGRDPSHGHAHMEAVARRSVEIAQQLKIAGNLYPSLIAVAWLHDVGDPKYDPQEALWPKMEQFLRTEGLTPWILTIVRLISYSQEVKDREQWGTEYRNRWKLALSKPGLLIRDIVSDADKLEALGVVGYERCAEYTRSKFPTLPENEIHIKVIAHAREKLLRLRDEFIVTSPGKELAIPLHDELVDCLRSN